MSLVPHITAFTSRERLCLLIVPLLLFSCLPNKSDQSRIKALPGSLWKETDTLSYTFFIGDYTVPYAVQINTVHNGLYPYRRLDLGIEVLGKSGFTLRDNLQLPLSERPGRWKGIGVARTQTNFVLTPSLRLPAPGLYDVRLYLNAAPKQVRGVEAVGITLAPMQRQQ